MTAPHAMKGRHQFRRRFSLQPSFHKEESDDERRHHSNRHEENSQAGVLASSGTHVKHKIVMMGAAKVGKSSLISQFLYNTFSPKYKETIEEMHHGDFSVSGVSLTLDILDTCGSCEFPAMRALSISSADAFILVYDVNDGATFDEVRALRDQIHETKGGTAVPIVVVGNKADLAEERREVDFDTTESVVSVDWENGFVECSAKNNTNVTQVFKELLTQAKVKYNLSPALRKKRRQSMARHSISGGSTSTPAAHSSPIPSPAQLQHLQQIRERHSGGKRNSCILS